MASFDETVILTQQREAINVLNTDGLAAYDQCLHDFGILDFLNEEEKEYLVSLNLKDVIFSGSEDDDEEEDGREEQGFGDLQRQGRYCHSLEIDGPPLFVAAAKTETRMIFSPGICKEIIKLINNSSHSIKIAMFMFTEQSIFKEICKKKNSNPEIDIFILVDATQFDEFQTMAQKIIKNQYANKEVGIKVKGIMRKAKGFQGKTSGKAHEKFMIVDEASAVMGSFNFTWTSEHINYEQVIISNDDAIVTPLLKQFKKLSRKVKYQIL